MTTKSDAGMGQPRALEVAATRRQVVRALPVAAAAFAIPGSFVPGESGNVQAQTRPSPLTGHFHPKGKAPSQVHAGGPEAGARADAALCRHSATSTSRRRGLIAPMTELKIMADAGHVAWDMERFQFLDQAGRVRQHPPLAAPPVAAQQQLRPLRGHPRHLPGARLRPLRHHLRPRQDRLDRLRPAGERRAGPRRLEALPEACRRGPAGLGGDLLAHPWRPLGRRAGHRRRGRCALGQGSLSSRRSTSWTSPSPRTSTPATP